jgi:4a-hydroxytetrahydrobiopterin dehydratase
VTTPLLTDEEISSRLNGSAWERDEGEIVRNVTLPDFAEAIALVNRIAEVAEEHNHHPDIFVHGWNKVRLSLYNHSAGGLTEVDFEMAARFDQLL